MLQAVFLALLPAMSALPEWAAESMLTLTPWPGVTLRVLVDRPGVPVCSIVLMAGGGGVLDRRRPLVPHDGAAAVSRFYAASTTKRWQYCPGSRASMRPRERVDERSRSPRREVRHVVRDGSEYWTEFKNGRIVVARHMTFLPSDILLTGTPANSRPLEAGDTIHAEVTGIGRLFNKVVEMPVPRSAVGFPASPDSDGVRRVALGNEERLPEKFKAPA